MLACASRPKVPAILHVRQMDKIGTRLREERVRMQLSQMDFGAIGGVRGYAQWSYERGVRSPSAIYLARIAEAGADVLYIVTGRRSRVKETDTAKNEAMFANKIQLLQPHERKMISILVEWIATRR